MISTVIEALCVGIMCAVCYRIGWNKGTDEAMNDEEIIKNFIITGKAIYKLSLMEAESEGLEIPDSVTVSATGADGKIIEITIAIKDGEQDD